MKKLSLSYNKKFLGVCGGFGDYFEIDPAVVRIIWVVGTLISFGLGIFLYFISYLIISSK
ncbi:MAG TPA: PspC domain-containing protein [bacterium]|nr:PspC domain-containing protein [bacterium]